MNYVVLGVAVFCIGAFGMLVRRNLIVVLMSLELMLSAINILFAAFSKMHGGLDGQVFILFNFVVAACEAAVGLAIIVALFRLRGTVNIGKWRELKG